MINQEYKNLQITALTNYLVPLRAKVGISQEALSNMVGISRQTYYAIESGKRKMSWNTFLSLLLFFDTNENTHDMLRDLGLYPYDFMEAVKKGSIYN